MAAAHRTVDPMRPIDRASIAFLFAVFLALPAGAGPGAPKANAAPLCQGVTLEVGPGRSHERIEDALEAAQPGATILVYPRLEGVPYEQVACYVAKPDITLRAVPSEDGGHVTLSGEGFDYSGVGRTPRAIVQFMPGADRCRLEGFELHSASNGSHNGAGVRIAGANHVTISHCDIHGNDMGIMSNGDGTLERGLNQVIEYCHIHHNGNEEEPGLNHNLYLGGASVTVRYCEVSHSITGHNLKSRAHHTRVEACFLHDSSNRELDLVDGRETELEGSHAVLLANLIVKAEGMSGNRSVIHFGQDGGGARNGTLHLAFNTVVTPYRSPLVHLSAPGTSAVFVGNILWDRGAGGSQVLVAATHGADLERVEGERNWLASGFEELGETKLSRKTSFIARRGANPGFVDAEEGDYRIIRKARRVLDAGPRRGDVSLPPVPGAAPPAGDAEPFRAWEYGPGQTRVKRKDTGRLDLGAFGRV